MIAKMAILAVLAGMLASCVAEAQPRPETLAVFDHYVAQAEARIQKEESSPDSFLSMISPRPTEREARLRRGEMLMERYGVTPRGAPGGLIHDWQGIIFIPNATIDRVLSPLQDYQHLTRYYRPEVMASQLISRKGDDFHVSMRLREHRVITVVLDSEYDVHYGRLDALHQCSFARSTRIAEIVNAGERDEHALAPGQDHGFLWRLNTYWRFVQAPDGVFVQCEAISLSRDVPAGLGWLIGALVENIPRESLHFTLCATRDAALAE